MEKKYTWDLTDIFKTNEGFENEIKNLNNKLEEIKEYQGSLIIYMKKLWNTIEKYMHMVCLNFT